MSSSLSLDKQLDEISRDEISNASTNTHCETITSLESKLL